MRLRIRKGSNDGKEVPPNAPPSVDVEDDITNLLDDIELLKGRREEKRRARKEEEEELPHIEEPQADIADSARGQGEGWAISLLRSLDGAPDDMVSMLPLNVLQKALEGVAKSQGDVGILARVVLKRLRPCLEGK